MFLSPSLILSVERCLVLSICSSFIYLFRSCKIATDQVLLRDVCVASSEDDMLTAIVSASSFSVSFLWLLSLCYGLS